MVQEVKRKRTMAIDLRARIPALARFFALAVLVAGIGFVVVSYYRLRGNNPFVMISQTPELSKNVVSEIDGYDRRVTEGDRLRLWLRAAHAKTFDDGHHELQTVDLEVYPAAGGDKPDKIAAQNAIYDPNNSTITFTGAVNVTTRDALTAKTEAVAYDQKTEVANVTTPVTFARENVSGRADTATIDAKNKRLGLTGAVEITVTPNANASAAPLNVNGANGAGNGAPVVIRSAQAAFDQASMRLAFWGGATAEQGGDVMSGESLAANLSEQKKVNKIETRTNSYLRSMKSGRAAEIFATNIDFFFDPNQKLQAANASTNVRAHTLDADAEAQITTNSTLIAEFDVQSGESILRQMRADGRPVLTLAAPKSKANDPNAASKRLTADNVQMFWRIKGKDLERAEAVGNAELLVEPVQATLTNDRKTLTAPRFDCEFYESGNLAKVFNATGGARAVIVPMQPSDKREQRTLTSQRMTATFQKEAQDVEQLDAAGEARFNEADRNGQAQNISYTARDEVVRLRGGEPVVWDARARLKADEIDSDTRNKISYGRGHTATTYYSQEQTGGATPFAKTKSPVYTVSDRAEFQHNTGIAIYTGNARAWQEDNFVRGNQLTLRREQKMMEANGAVQSALYQAKRKDPNGAQQIVPVFATAERMTYSDADRVLHYERNVDIKQGTERMTSEVADVYMLRDKNEVDKTIAQRNVVMTQPGKRGTGDWAQYVAADETFVLTGNPARVDDTEQGVSESRRITVFLREDRVVSDGAPQGNNAAGRVRSTHRVRKQ